MVQFVRVSDSVTSPWHLDLILCTDTSPCTFSISPSISEVPAGSTKIFGKSQGVNQAASNRLWHSKWDCKEKRRNPLLQDVHRHDALSWLRDECCCRELPLQLCSQVCLLCCFWKLFSLGAELFHRKKSSNWNNAASKHKIRGIRYTCLHKSLISVNKLQLLHVLAWAQQLEKRESPWIALTVSAQALSPPQ